MAMRRIAFLIALCLAVLAAALPTPTRVRAERRPPLAVVVGLSIKMTDISLAQLRSIFQGDMMRAPDGKRFMPVNAPLNTYERELFDRKVLGLAPEEVSRYWVARRIRDEGMPPRTLPSADLGARVVASYPGAIAYVSVKLVTSSVRVLRVDGKLPSDAGYLLVDD